MNEKISFDSIINTLVQQSNVSKTFAHSFIKEMAVVIQQGLLQDSVVKLSGFGVFKLHAVPARLGRNIQSGETITIPAHRKVLFKPERHLRELINKNYRHLKAVSLNEQDDFAPAEAIAAKVSSPSESKNLNGHAKEHIKAETEELLNEQAGNNIGDHNVPIRDNKLSQDDHLQKAPLLITLIVILTILFIYFQFNEEEPELEKEVIERVKPASIAKKKESVSQVQQAEKINKKPPIIKEKKVPSIKTHRAEDGDNLWNLAFKYYNDGYLWPLILQANKDKITNPDFIQSGIKITIPPVLKKNDQKLLAKGHLLAYKEYKKNKDEEALNHLYVAYKVDKEFVESFVGNIDIEDLKYVKTLFEK